LGHGIIKLMSDLLEKFLEGDNKKNLIYGIVVVGIFFSLILFTNTKNTEKQKNFLTNDNRFNLALAMNGVRLKYGLQSKSAPESEDLELKDYVNDQNLNLSDDLTDSLILANIYLNLNKTIDSTSTRLGVINNIYNDYRTMAKGKIYTENDLNIIKNETIKDILLYSKNLEIIILNFKKQISNWNNKKDISILINIYQDTQNSLLSLAVPDTGKMELVVLINYFQKNIAYFKSLQTIKSDPIKYSLLFYNNNSIQTANEFNGILSAIKNYFLTKDLK